MLLFLNLVFWKDAVILLISSSDPLSLLGRLESLFSLMICSFYDLCNLTQFGKVQVLFFKQSLSQLS